MVTALKVDEAVGSTIKPSCFQQKPAFSPKASSSPVGTSSTGFFIDLRVHGTGSRVATPSVIVAVLAVYPDQRRS